AAGGRQAPRRAPEGPFPGRLARHRGRGRHGAREPLPGGVRAHGSRRAPRRLRALTLASLDRAGLRLARTLGHTRRAERAVAAFSRLGEHAACWLALGTTGAVLDPARRREWGRATATVAGAFV